MIHLKYPKIMLYPWVDLVWAAKPNWCVYADRNHGHRLLILSWLQIGVLNQDEQHPVRRITTSSHTLVTEVGRDVDGWNSEFMQDGWGWYFLNNKLLTSTGAAGGQTVWTTFHCVRLLVHALDLACDWSLDNYTPVISSSIIILSYTYQIKINHGGQQQLQGVLQQQLQSGLDLLVQKDGFELESPEKTSFGQQMLIDIILDTRQLQNPSLHCVLDR